MPFTQFWKLKWRSWICQSENIWQTVKRKTWTPTVTSRGGKKPQNGWDTVRNISWLWHSLVHDTLQMKCGGGKGDKWDVARPISLPTTWASSGDSWCLLLLLLLLILLLLQLPSGSFEQQGGHRGSAATSNTSSITTKYFRNYYYTTSTLTLLVTGLDCL